MIAFILVIVGGLNWGLEAIGFNVVYLLVGAWPVVEDIVYILVGLSALYLAVTHWQDYMGGGGKPMGGMGQM